MKVWLKAALVLAGVAAAGGVLWWTANRVYAGTFDLHELIAGGDPVPIRYVLAWQPAKLRAVDPFGRTALHEAILRPDIQLAELLVQAGAPVNAADRLGRTPLHAAADSGRDPAVRLLLAAGANVNAQDRDGWTPLHYAAVHDAGSIVTALLNAGAKANLPDKTGATPLDWAVVLLVQERAAQALRQGGGKTSEELAPPRPNP